MTPNAQAPIKILYLRICILLLDVTIDYVYTNSDSDASLTCEGHRTQIFSK